MSDEEHGSQVTQESSMGIVTCPVCENDAHRHPPHREREYQCFNVDCWLGSFYPEKMEEENDGTK